MTRPVYHPTPVYHQNRYHANLIEPLSPQFKVEIHNPNYYYNVHEDKKYNAPSISALNSNQRTGATGMMNRNYQYTRDKPNVDAHFVQKKSFGSPGIQYKDQTPLRSSKGQVTKQKDGLLGNYKNQAPSKLQVDSYDTYYTRKAEKENPLDLQYKQAIAPRVDDQFYSKRVYEVPKYEPRNPSAFNTYMSSPYTADPYFKMCIDYFMNGKKLVDGISQNSFLFKSDSKFGQEVTYYTAIRSVADDELEGMYKLYKYNMNDRNLFNKMQFVLPEFQGCSIHNGIDNQRKSLKARGDYVFFMYEQIPNYLDVLKDNSIVLAEINLVEMVHQLFFFFRNLFKGRLFVKYFKTTSIGLKLVDNAAAHFRLHSTKYSRNDLLYVFRHPESISSMCNYKLDFQFQQLLSRFKKIEHKQFQHKGEEDVEICQQINMINLILMLEVVLYRANGLTVDKSVLFKGCLDEAEDAGFDCPLSILRLLGKASQGERYRSDGITNEHYLCMQNLRENPLKYTTKSIIDWFKKFINDLLHVYRFSQLSSESVAYQPSSLNRIKFNMEYQRNMVQKIEDMRKQTNDPTLYDSEMTQIKQGIESLYHLKKQAKDKGTQTGDLDNQSKNFASKVTDRRTNDRQEALNLYKEEKPFVSDDRFKQEMGSLIKERKDSRREDALVLDNPNLSMHNISNVETSLKILGKTSSNGNNETVVTFGQPRSNSMAFDETAKFLNQDIEVQKLSPIGLKTKKSNFETQNNVGFSSQKSVDFDTIERPETVIDSSRRADTELKILVNAMDKNNVSSQAKSKKSSSKGLDSSKIMIQDELEVEQSMVDLDMTKTESQRKVGALINHDITQMQSEISAIQSQISTEKKGLPSSRTSGIVESSVNNTVDQTIQFEEGEQMKFVNKIDHDGMEYLSLEINLNMINPEDFGFDNYDKSKDQSELDRKVKNHFIQLMQNDESMQNLGFKVLDLI